MDVKPFELRTVPVAGDAPDVRVKPSCGGCGWRSPWCRRSVYCMCLAGAVTVLLLFTWPYWSRFVPGRSEGSPTPLPDCSSKGVNVVGFDCTIAVTWVAADMASTAMNPRAPLNLTYPSAVYSNLDTVALRVLTSPQMTSVDGYPFSSVRERLPPAGSVIKGNLTIGQASLPVDLLRMWEDSEALALNLPLALPANATVANVTFASGGALFVSSIRCAAIPASESAAPMSAPSIVNMIQAAQTEWALDANASSSDPFFSVLRDMVPQLTAAERSELATLLRLNGVNSSNATALKWSVRAAEGASASAWWGAQRRALPRPMEACDHDLTAAESRELTAEIEAGKAKMLAKGEGLVGALAKLWEALVTYKRVRVLSYSLLLTRNLRGFMDGLDQSSKAMTRLYDCLFDNTAAQVEAAASRSAHAMHTMSEGLAQRGTEPAPPPRLAALLSVPNCGVASPFVVRVVRRRFSVNGASRLSVVSNAVVKVLSARQAAAQVQFRSWLSAWAAKTP